MRKFSPEFKSFLADKNWLYQQHHTENKTIREISKHLGCTRRGLSKIFKKFDIPIKTSSHISQEIRIKLDNKNWLEEQHHKFNKSMTTIAKELGVKAFCISKRFNEYGIKKRQSPGNNWRNICKTTVDLKIKLSTLHHIDKKNLTEIAKAFNVNVSTVSLWFSKFKIKVNKDIFWSSPEKEVVEFIKKLTDTQIIENDKNILYPKELDIYLPQKNLAIEFDGVYWHSKYDKEYHVGKTENCIENGIQLLHIFDTEWREKRKIWESMIANKLGKSQRIFGRNTTMHEISNEQEKTFLSENHIQGYTNSSFRLGLKFNEELICLMTFGKPRFNRNFDWELIRFCSKIGTQVIGGASKLFKKFISEKSPDKIISYADRRYSNGQLYKSLGFDFIKNSEPSYYYTDGKNLFSRYKFQKHKLEKQIAKYDKNLSERENMLKSGYQTIYGCGNMVFVYNNLSK